MPDQPEMSPATKELLKKVRMMVPPMLEKFHKGMLGRVAVIGGSENYTGAPYFSAMASARLVPRHLHPSRRQRDQNLLT
ncbi:MAG: hypothetical protein Q9226_006757 [Calogaya cf. arnoldii]